VHAARLVPSHAPAQAPVPAHAAREPTGAPVAGEQVPSSPAALHASHWPSQAVSQHTPSTHWPDVHSSVVAHIPPLGRRPTHIPSMHALPIEHCALLVHAVRQPLSPHAYGAHGDVLAAGHAPAPSHTAGSVADPSAHEAARHDVASPG
jgi:hypothetical protein